MLHLTRWRTRGQSLVIVTLFLFVLFLLVGLSIDGGLLYVQRRLMQNTADAACLAAATKLALGATNTVAQDAAVQIITTNLGTTPGSGVNAPGTLAYTNISQVYSPAAGTGTALTRGIEMNGPEVRVALQSSANTYFMRVGGITSYTAAARAHCNAAAAGGGTPFAVARWRGYNASNTIETGLTTEDPLPQTYKSGKANINLTVRDVLKAGSSGNGVITSWPWTTSTYPGSPAGGDGMYSQASPAATTSDPGYETVIAGGDANANGPSNSGFTGPIVLDFRQTTFPQPLYYNGLTPDTALNQYKDFATRYIVGNYPGPSVIPGQQIGYYSGVSAGLVEKPFDERYNVGDIVTALVYNGTIYTNPDFTLTYPSSSDSTASRTGGGLPSGVNCSGASMPAGFVYDNQSGKTARIAPATYKATVTPQVSSRFELRAFLSNEATNVGNISGTWSGSTAQALPINPDPLVRNVSTSGQTFSLGIAPTDTISCLQVTGGITSTVDMPIRKNTAEMIYLESRDQNTGKRRALYATLAQTPNANDFYAYFPGQIAYAPLYPGDSLSTAFSLQSAGSGSNLSIGTGASDVAVAETKWFATNLTSIGAPSGITVNLSKQSGGNMFTVNIATGVATGQEYYVRFKLSKGGFSHYLWYYLQVRPSLNNSSSITSYVTALGYASFKITNITSNNIYGQAITGLVKPEDVKFGLLPRLQAW